MTSKTCFKCGGEKPIFDFYKHPKMADGHLNKCKPCTRSDVAKHRADNLQHCREYDRQRAKLPSRRESAAKVISEWRAKHPQRRAAHVALGNAVRTGRIQPWPVCAVPECRGKPEAHHPDYSRPLDVVWLCPSHHKQTHSMFRNLITN